MCAAGEMQLVVGPDSLLCSALTFPGANSCVTGNISEISVPLESKLDDKRGMSKDASESFAEVVEENVFALFLPPEFFPPPEKNL